MGANYRTAESKARGGNIAGLYGDELTLQPIEFLKQVFQRLSLEGSRAFGATNPDSPFHPLKVEFLDRQADLKGIVKSFHWDIEKNIFLRPDYIAELKRLYPEGSLWYKRFILGLWVAAEGAIYDSWNDETHRLKHEPSLEPDYYAVACDYGTQNAFVAGLFPIYDKPLKIHPFHKLETYLRRTYYYDGRAQQKQKTDSEYAQELIEWMGYEIKDVQTILVDPSAASFKAELRQALAARNQNHIRVVDAKNSVADGIRTVARMLHAGAFRIGPDSSNNKVVKEMVGYVWDSKARDRGKEEPLKVNDHGPDMIRYLVYTLFKNFDVTSESQAQELYL
jgi:PBSX family phage terminase large subunit